MILFSDLERVKFDLPANPQEKWAKLRQEILETVPSVEDGINRQRIKNFMEGLGMSVTPLIFLDANGLKKLKKIFKAYAYRYEWIVENHFSGVYAPEVGIAFVNRFRDKNSFNGQAWEEWNGSKFVEGFAVHELAHAFVSNGIESTKLQGKFFAETGFKRVEENKGERGVFWEEGFADLIRGKFIAERFPSSTMIGLTEIDGRKIPLKYFYFDEQNRLCLIKSSISGYALELLIFKHPELLDVLIKCRKSSNPIGELKAFMDQKYPGLFLQLYELKDSEPEYLKGFDIVNSVVGNV